MDKHNEDTRRFLRDLPFFRAIPQADLKALAAEAASISYNRGTILFNQGDKANRFFVILSGWIALYRTSPDTGDCLIGHFTRGDTFGEGAVFCNSRYPFSARATDDAKVLEIPGSSLTKRAKTSPGLMDRIINSMGRSLHSLEVESGYGDLLSASQRVGCLLLQISAGLPDDDKRTLASLSFTYAAQRLGMPDDTFAHALARLSKVGITVTDTGIIVESVRALTEYIDANSSYKPG